MNNTSLRREAEKKKKTIEYIRHLKHTNKDHLPLVGGEVDGEKGVVRKV